MMKASKNVHRWRPLVGVIAVGALAFGLSLRLEGAPVPGGTGKASDRVVGVTAKEVKAARAVSRIDRISGIPQQNGQTVSFGNLTNRLSGDVPIMPVTVVDYRDDEGTRMRDAGLLVGPLPMPTRLQGGVAAVGTACLSTCTGAGTPLACCTGAGTGTCVCCSFAVDCDDGNPCTKDACNLEPGDTEDTGICANDPAPGGGDGAVGTINCPANFGLLCLGCDDGLYCNGLETCVSGACQPGTSPCSGGQVCSESLNVCHAPCGNDDDCKNLNATTLLHCNGTETCSGTICQAGANPCGGSAACGERKCTNTDPETFACITDEDCAAYNSGDSFCTIQGPICAPGRCCKPPLAPGGEPVCSKRTLAECNTAGGLFYAGDKGSYPFSGGQACPIESKIQIKCPKYASGMEPAGPYTHLFGPISDSPINRICIGGDNGGATCTPTSGNCTGGGTCSPLTKLGDDYKMTNDPGFISLDFLRFTGGSMVTDRISFEFYDASGNFVEDFLFSSSEAFGVYPVVFEPPIVIPSDGYVVARTASHFSAEAMHAWAATDAVDVGANVDTKLWINGGPTTVPSSLGILAFELVGLNTTGPSGACCDPDTLGCDNAQLRWACRGANKSYLGDGTLCAACDTGPNVNEYCRRCSNDSAPCNKDADCGAGNTCTTTPPVSACGSPGVCVAEPACGVGACCNPTLGTCTVIDETTCTNGGGNYQGHGTDCDADNGYDESRMGASPVHCCPQPVMTGADNCEDVTLHVIPALAPGETIVVTITGNNTPATSTTANPDSCNSLSAPSADPDAEPGWWEGFTLEGGCTMLYLTYCCSDPVHYGVYVHIYNACPCSGLIGSSANPYAPYYRAAEESPFFRGGPYCAEDDNLWQSFPFMKAGTYWHPVHSQLSAVHGAYQINLVATGCPTAACCLGDACTDGVNQLECDALEGYFLAPPQKYPTVAACTDASAPCDAGSCCRGPGDCFDADVGGQPVNPGDCN
ncbi:MAG: hypothetical protein Q7R41_03775 [Phycisphaerales bacterium]|nr:hypothetical protein [Phycisphaerales bacterium]